MIGRVLQAVGRVWPPVYTINLAKYGRAKKVTILTSDRIGLKNRILPYPPFKDYSISLIDGKPQNVKLYEYQPPNLSHPDKNPQEGYLVLEFLEKGTYKIGVNSHLKTDVHTRSYKINVRELD